jgi:O-antigen chain-terminating methyltransferase
MATHNEFSGQKKMQPNQSTADSSTSTPGLFPVDATLGVDELMERVRAEVERRRSELLADVQASDASGQGPGASLPRWTGAARHMEVKPAYALGELLQFADEEFVGTAYRVLLRRPPDAEGVRHYLEALRNGWLSKVQILGEIRFSEEGRRADVHVDGLMIPYKLQGLRRIPVLGRLVAFAAALAHLPSLSRYLQSMESASARASQDIGHLINRIDVAVEGRLDAIDGALVDKASLANARFIEARIDAVEASVTAMARALAERDAEISALRDTVAGFESLRETVAGFESLRDTVASLSSLRDDVARLDAQAQASASTAGGVASDMVALRRGLLDLQRKAVAQIQDAASIAGADPARGAEASESASQMAEHVFDADYVSFEDAFRGSRDDIKERASEYLPHFEAAGITPESGRVVDLGCGRGEWLDVLVERGFEATGVDMNPAMLDECRQRGFDVVEADAVGYLARQPDESVAVITSMHLVEHLPHDVVVRLVDEARRVLKPGGILILETPNPENITVGSCWFYMDPTHRNPIPPALLEWTVSNRGFDGVEILRQTKNRGDGGIAPWDASMVGADSFNRLVGWFNAAPDYAVLGKKA